MAFDIDQQLYELPPSITILDFHDFVYNKPKFVRRVLLRVYSSTANAKYVAARDLIAGTQKLESLRLNFEDTIWARTTSKKIQGYLSKIEEDLGEFTLLQDTLWLFQYRELSIRFKVDRLYQSAGITIAQYILGSKDTSALIKWMCESGAVCTSHDVAMSKKITTLSCSSGGVKTVRAKGCDVELEKYVELIAKGAQR